MKTYKKKSNKEEMNKQKDKKVKMRIYRRGKGERRCEEREERKGNERNE